MKVINMKSDINSLIDKANMAHIARIDDDDTSRFEEYNLELEIIENLRRIYYHSKRMAKSVIELSEDGGTVVEVAA